MQRNKAAFQKARSLIRKHQYVKDSDWSEAQPGTDAENDFIDRNGWAAFADELLDLYDRESA